MRPKDIHLSILLLAALAMLAVGTYIGLFVAPAERHMGDVQRIMYIHVPTAWASLAILTFAFVTAIGSLWSGKRSWDAVTVGAIEVGVLLTVLLMVQGSIWARATWGVWWDWDVRLTTSLVMALLFAGVLALRSIVDSPERRATWTAVATIVSFVDVPIVYYSVRWWRSLHQIQSSPETVDAAMVLPLRINAIGMVLLAAWLCAWRTRIERRRLEAEIVEMPERRAPEEVLADA